MLSDTERRIKEFLAAHTTMTLATVAEDGRPQAASLFYAEMEDFSLVYISEKKVRHSQNLLRDSRAAATIYGDGQKWQEIQGLQIEGLCSQLAGQQARTAHAAYLDKFPFIKANLLIGAVLKISTFYKLRPQWIRLIDNTSGFGHKEEWRPGDNGPGSVPGFHQRPG